jgi:hypothetical protein
MQPAVVTVNSVMNLLVSFNSIKQQIIGHQPDTVYCTLNIFNTVVIQSDFANFQKKL